MLKTIICDSDDSPQILRNYPVKTISRLDDNQIMILIHDNLDFKHINKLNKEMNLELLNPKKVKSNVIAAITAIARIHMMTIKTLPGVEIFYTDTDSFFVVVNIPNYLLDNSEIGLFKNELEYKDNGIVKLHKIVKAYFFE